MDDRRMAVALGEFARTLTSDFSVQTFLDRLVEHVVAILRVDGAGVLVMVDETHHRFVASTDPVIRSIERLQLELGEGPCLRAFTSGEYVAVPDLGRDREFSSFSPKAAATGMCAVYSFPMRLDSGRLGVLEVWSAQPLQMSDEDLAGAQTLADVAAAYLFNADARRQSDESVAELAAKALRDPLTGLPNRTDLQHKMDGVMTRSRESQTFAALLFIDIDRFKAVNDTWGHQVGDEVLYELVRRLQPLVPPGGCFARLSGDEFVLLCEGLSDLGQAEDVAGRILVALAEPFLVGELSLGVTVSIGIAFAGHNRETPDAALVHADAAMYRAKAQGGRRFAVASTLNPIFTDPRQPVGRDLAAGLGADALHLVYQPIFGARDDEPVAVEALLRWEHPQLGALSPLEIVTAAQRVGLSMPLLRWVLGQVSSDLLRWDGLLGPAAPPVAGVNMAFRELMHPDVVPLVTQVLTEQSLPPDRICLEITEDVFLADATEAAHHLESLHALGLGVALDGFGDGFSSLVDLKTLPVTAVKIGRAFVAGVVESPVDQAIVSAVVHLSDELGLTVVAEGVETVAQHDLVRDLGCDQMQGRLLAAPLPAERLEALLAAPAG
jgi:diguanylate cyclase (GGDEF)-like protein